MGKLTRLGLSVLIGLAVYYAVFGGQYSVFEVRRTRTLIEAQTAELGRLHREIDSLRARTDSLETDSVALERLARERFGMIRDGEVLYRFAEPEDTLEPPLPGGPGGT